MYFIYMQECASKNCFMGNLRRNLETKIKLKSTNEKNRSQVQTECNFDQCSLALVLKSEAKLN
jgi:hypothetical protein